VDILDGTENNKIIAIRHTFWAQNNTENVFCGWSENPARVAYSAPPDPLAGFKSPLRSVKGGKEKGIEEEGKEREGEGKGLAPA